MKCTPKPSSPTKNTNSFSSPSHRSSNLPIEWIHPSTALLSRETLHRATTAPHHLRHPHQPLTPSSTLPNPNKIQIEQRKKDVLRDCRVLEEQLSAKMEPVDELGNGGDLDGHLMLNAFQKALLNQRGLFRRTNGKEKLPQVEYVSGVIGQDDGLTGGQLTSGMPMIPERLTDGGGPKTTNSGNYPLHSYR